MADFLDFNLRDWFEMNKRRDEESERFGKEAKIKKCKHCGLKYSYGYYPVWEDPGACQKCRGAEGDLIY